MSGYGGGGGGGISASIGSDASNTTLSFVNVTATSNTALAGRSRTGIDCVGCVVAPLAGVVVECTWMRMVTSALWCFRLWWWDIHIHR